MNLTLKQSRALKILEDDKTVELYYGGAAGGGKSALGCFWQIKQRLRYPGSRGLIGRSVLKTLKETTLQTFFEIAKIQGLKRNLHFTLTTAQDKEHPNCIVFANGSVIFLKDLFAYPNDPDFDELGSLEITDAFIDESPQITSKAKGIVRSRMRYKLDEFKVIPKLLMTGNPSKGWAYTEFYKPAKLNEMRPDKKFIQALPNDNPHLPKSYLESLAGLDKNSKERLLFGNWEYDDNPAAMCDYDSILALFENDHVQLTGTKYITADIARFGSDKAIVAVWDGWVVIEWNVFDKSKTTEIQTCINAMRTKHNIPKHFCIADEDGVGGGVVDNCGIQGFVNNSTPIEEKTPEGMEKMNYQNLQAQCAYKLAAKINEHAIYIKAELSQAHREELVQDCETIESYKTDSDGKLRILPKEKVKEKTGRSPDWRDVLLMRIYFELKAPVKVSKPTVFTGRRA